MTTFQEAFDHLNNVHKILQKFYENRVNQMKSFESIVNAQPQQLPNRCQQVQNQVKSVQNQNEPVQTAQKMPNPVQHELEQIQKQSNSQQVQIDNIQKETSNTGQNNHSKDTSNNLIA